MIDFKTLKNNSGKKSIETLNAEIEKMNTSYSNEDETFWTPTVDKAGNGSATIRFLSTPKGESLPWIKYYDHGFQGPGGWYIEKSLTTLGKDDPVSDHNSELWNSGSESNKEIARKQKRRLSHVSNILVITDPGKPECEGKVFKYRYGQKIFNKITESMHPEDEDEVAINPFDFWEGANFKLRIKKVEGYPNYDSSKFVEPSALFDGDDKKLEELWNNLYSLVEINDPKHFKSYDELKIKLCKVLGDTQYTKVHSKPREEDVKELPPKKEKEVVPFDTNDNIDDDPDIQMFFSKLKENS